MRRRTAITLEAAQTQLAKVERLKEQALSTHKLRARMLFEMSYIDFMRVCEQLVRESREERIDLEIAAITDWMPVSAGSIKVTNRRRKLAMAKNANDRWLVQLSYAAEHYTSHSEVIENELATLAKKFGGDLDGSGMGFGRRDVDYLFSAEKNAAAFGLAIPAAFKTQYDIQLQDVRKY